MKIVLHSARRIRKDKLLTIEFEAYLTRTDRVFISTGVVIDPKFWDNRSFTVKHTHPDFHSLNTQISLLRERLNEINERYLKAGETLTGPILRLEVKNERTAKTFNQYFAEQIELDRPSVKILTYKKFKYILNSFNEFKEVPLTSINTTTIREYHNYLLTRMKLSTTGKNHKVIKKYLKRAYDEKLITNNPYSTFKIPKDNRRRTFLTPDELDRIRTKNFASTRLELVRDMFLFMTNTGLEFIDMVQLSSSDITEINGKKYLIKARVKVEREIQAIPLLDEAVSIIDKYNTGSGKLFPVKSNQKLNEYLKEIADVCGIEKNLSTIIARHTFATLMLTMGMPLESVSHMLGHSNTATTRIYAKMLVNKLDNDFERLNIKSI